MITFSDVETQFLKSMEECRIATTNGVIPHVKPVSYIFENGKFYLATDYDTRTFKNLKENPRIALVVDIYKHEGHKAVSIQGSVKIIENGDEFQTTYIKFHEKFEWVRKESWNENEAPFIVIEPKTKVSWGL